MNNDQTELAQVALASEQTIEGPSEDWVAPKHNRLDYVGFKAPLPWEGWTDEERKAAFGGFLYPSWYPFAVCEPGNFQPSMFDGVIGFRSAKVHGEVDETMEDRKKAFPVMMQNKNGVAATAKSPVGVLKRAKASKA